MMPPIPPPDRRRFLACLDADAMTDQPTADRPPPDRPPLSPGARDTLFFLAGVAVEMPGRYVEPAEIPYHPAGQIEDAVAELLARGLVEGDPRTRRPRYRLADHGR
jgi:hypothetical protein